jgi:hypothetical protein
VRQLTLVRVLRGEEVVVGDGSGCSEDAKMALERIGTSAPWRSAGATEVCW